MTLVKRPRPVLRYHGGKWKIAPWVIQHFPPHRIYVEPFGGGASVLLRKPRSYAEVYNDLDGEVVNVFRVMQDPDTASQLAELLRLTPFARAEFEAAYQESPDPVERARRTIIKAFMGFGSNAIHDNRPSGMRTRASTWRAPTGFRSNSNRSGTTPAHDWANYPDHVAAYCERLQGVVIECRPAAGVIRAHDRADTLHYLDPPYVHQTRREALKRSGHMYRHEMTDEQHRELAELLHSLRGHVVLSGYHSALYDELYTDWPRFETRALADGAARRTEVLWLSPRTFAALGVFQLQLRGPA